MRAMAPGLAAGAATEGSAHSTKADSGSRAASTSAWTVRFCTRFGIPRRGSIAKRRLHQRSRPVVSAPQRFPERVKVLGDRCLDDPWVTLRAWDRHSRGVKGDPREAENATSGRGDARRPTVRGVAKQRRSRVTRVDTKLMRPPRKGREREQCA